MLLDFALYGGDSAKLLYIISEIQEQIAKRILAEIDIGITLLKAEGAYTKNDKKVIMCVCRKYNYTKVTDIRATWRRKYDKERKKGNIIREQLFRRIFENKESFFQGDLCKIKESKRCSPNRESDLYTRHNAVYDNNEKLLFNN